MSDSVTPYNELSEHVSLKIENEALKHRVKELLEIIAKQNTRRVDKCSACGSKIVMTFEGFGWSGSHLCIKTASK